MCWKGTRRISCFHHYTWVGSTCSIVCACTDYGSSVFRLMISWLSVKSCLWRMWTIHHLHYWTGFLSWDNFLTRYPVNYCWEPLFMFSKIVCYVFFLQSILMVTVKYTLMSIRSTFLSLLCTFIGLVVLCLYEVLTFPLLMSWGRQAVSSIHQNSIKPLLFVLRNVSNMFVAGLIVFC